MCGLQEVKDKYCTRVIEKLYNQLNGDRCSKSASNQDTTLLTLDDNTGGTSQHDFTCFCPSNIDVLEPYNLVCKFTVSEASAGGANMKKRGILVK